MRLKRFAKRFSPDIALFMRATLRPMHSTCSEERSFFFKSRERSGRARGDAKRDTMQIASNTDTYFVRGTNCDCSFVAADRNAIALASNVGDQDKRCSVFMNLDTIIDSAIALFGLTENREMLSQKQERKKNAKKN